MDPFSTLQVAAKIISICYDYRRGLKDAPKDLIRLTTEVTSLRNVLESLARLEENADTRESFHLQTLQLLNKPDGPLTRCRAELETLEEKLTVTSGWKAIGKALYWPLKEDDVRKTLENIQRLKATISLALSTDQTSTIVEDIISHCLSNPTAGVVYFYFDFNDAKKQYQESLIRSLITQLSTQSAKLSGALQTLYSHCQDGQQQPCYDTLVETFQSMLGDFSEIYIILDALDECADREQLLMLIQKINEWKMEKVHILVTSRKEKDVRETLTPLLTDQISIEGAQVNSDIQLYIRERLHNDPKLKLKKWSEKVREEIEETLMSGAYGMFRWVVCQLDELRKCLKVETLRKALKSLPKTLDDTYARILLNIDEDYAQDALKVLQWLSFSNRPLRIEEVAEVVAVDLESDPQFDSNRRLSEPHDLLIICSSLITVSSTTLELSNGTLEETEELRLAHFSVKEYLTSERIRAGPASKFHIPEIPAHLSIAQTCLVYLLQFNKPNSLTPNTGQECPLIRYAAKYWVEHAKASDASVAPLDHLTAKLFGLEKDCFLNWIRVYDPDLPWAEPDFSREVESIAPQLYYASLLGLNQVVQQLLERSADVNAQGGRLSNALQAASHYGHVQVVQQLLERGANINAQGGYLGNALQAASLRSHDQVVQRLLEWGADINAHGQEGSALLGASFHGNDQVVQQLLKWGADVNNQGGYFGNALQAASLNGHDQIVQRLLESGANVNAQGGGYGSALQAASRWGHDQIVQRLLEGGADVNAQGGQYGNALRAALVNGHDQVVQRLLEWGADNKTQGEESSAQQDASLSAHEQEEQFLTEDKRAPTEYTRLAGEVIQLQKKLEQQRAEIAQLRARNRDHTADTATGSTPASELMRYASMNYISLTDLEKLSEDELKRLDESLHRLVHHVRYSDWVTFCLTDKLDREFQEALRTVGVGWSEGLAQPYWTNGGVVPTPRDVRATAGEIRYYMDHGGAWYVPKIYPERINVMNALISLCQWRGVPLE
ncbi:hypothetical protein GP486_004039 [Trichoglossum hirsutum]|uniref:Ankyrin repeat protein n=1 Tax=Trichoglossum hirsutum TaxID=265104 RepID=A0A9P8LBV8_9PEZI|nr:hypothetical protein GP486_004039 [Trichoglossum hirsutum]